MRLTPSHHALGRNSIDRVCVAQDGVRRPPLFARKGGRLKAAEGAKQESRRKPALSFCSQNGCLLAETARDVAEHVLDLVAEHDQDYDDNHRDQDENEGVLYHTLPFLTVEQLTEAQIKAGQHAKFTSFSSRSNGPSFTSGRVQINARFAKTWRKTFDDSVTGESRPHYSGHLDR